MRKQKIFGNKNSYSKILGVSIITLFMLVTAMSAVVLFATPVEAVTPDCEYHCLTPNTVGDSTTETITNGLQEFIDGYSGVDLSEINVTTDQTQFQRWDFDTGVQTVNLEFEYVGFEAGNANVFGYYLNSDPNSFVGIFETKPQKKLSWTCLDPSLAFHEICEKNPTAICLMSGTLAPMENLGRLFNVEATMQDYPSIVPSKNVQMLVLRTGPNDDHLTSEYKHRNNPKIVKAYGETIQQIVSQIPN